MLSCGQAAVAMTVEVRTDPGAPELGLEPQTRTCAACKDVVPSQAPHCASVIDCYQSARILEEKRREGAKW